MTDQQKSKHPYDTLSPDLMLDAIETTGLRCDGSLLALNSYENRVYQIGIEDSKPIIAKFYRPGRWSDAAINEEHQFTLALAELEIPVVPPMALPDAETRQLTTLHHYQDFRFAIYTRHGGRWPDLDIPEHLTWMGRFIARIHTMGAAKAFEHRPGIDIQSYGYDSYHYLMSHGFIPAELKIPYSTLVEDVLKQVEAGFTRAGKVQCLRLHGDCHPGNILWTDDGPHFVDFDDARMGPAIQDLWMLLSGDRRQMTEQLDDVLTGYTEFRPFDPRELHLIEPLRTLRMINYSAWLARRWDDPAFPANFPWFNTNRYWEEQIIALREQAALMNEEPLVWYG